jgi:chromatin remodeling complex protein RSC6|tara:strand:+ start:4159 stop:4764 length:606 start_codon:yes stop_codon:yes gene_type:complete
MPGKTKTSASKAKKSSASKKTKAKTVEPVVETPVQEVTPAPVQETTDDLNYDDDFANVHAQLQTAMTTIKTLTTMVKSLEKRVARDRKVMNKKLKGRAKRVVDPNKPPSGFAKPGPISDELRSFLNLPKGELIARTEVTKKITEYCKAHNLQKAEDKRSIKTDAALKKLLRLNKNDELTFFNLQKYMKVHYPNKDGVFIHQ